MKNNLLNLSWLSAISAIGWDLDGTLYPSDAIPWDRVEEEKYRQLAAVNQWTIPEAQQQFSSKIKMLGSNTKTLEALGVDGEAFFTSVWDSLDLSQYIKPDVQLSSLMNKLQKRGIRQFILSNSNRVDQIEAKLELIGIPTHLFEVIVSTVGMAVKPDPAPYQKVIKQLSTSKMISPEQVLYVGDRVETDILGARSVGMRTCLVGKQSPEADLCVEKIYEVFTSFLS